jgi:methylglutaconyl-CoA hydratase
MRSITVTTTLLLEEQLDEATTVLTLNRPERRNALTIELMEGLCHAMESLAKQPGRRVVILRGAGPAFCSGLDLQEAAQPDVAEHSVNWVARTLEMMSHSPLITIAAAHGAAMAGGAGLLASCDFALATDDLKIGFPEVRRGLVPALVAAVVRDRLRDADARELFLLAEPITAERAMSIGLVNRIAPQDRLLDEARSLARTILRGAPDAVRQTKRLLRELHPEELASLLARALKVHKRSRMTAEAEEGVAAFLERREPDWSAE